MRTSIRPLQGVAHRDAARRIYDPRKPSQLRRLPTIELRMNLYPATSTYPVGHLCVLDRFSPPGLKPKSHPLNLSLGLYGYIHVAYSRERSQTTVAVSTERAARAKTKILDVEALRAMRHFCLGPEVKYHSRPFAGTLIRVRSA